MWLAAEVDRSSPGVVNVATEERRRIDADVVALRTEVIVDDIKKHHQPELVSAVNQRFELVRRSIGRARRIRSPESKISPCGSLSTVSPTASRRISADRPTHSAQLKGIRRVEAKGLRGGDGSSPSVGRTSTPVADLPGGRGLR